MFSLRVFEVQLASFPLGYSSRLSRPSGPRVGLPDHERDIQREGGFPPPITPPPFSLAPTLPLYPGGEPERGRKERYTPLSLLKVGYPVWSHRRYLAGALILVWHQPARVRIRVWSFTSVSLSAHEAELSLRPGPRIENSHPVQWPLDHLLLPLAFRLPFGWSTRKVVSPACCGVRTLLPRY